MRDFKLKRVYDKGFMYEPSQAAVSDDGLCN
jgi:hypothetical protein